MQKESLEQQDPVSSQPHKAATIVAPNLPVSLFGMAYFFGMACLGSNEDCKMQKGQS